MLSGIGPAAHLRDKGIDVLHDSPGVGRNLQEHPTASLEWNATQPVTFHSELRWDKLAFSALQWAVFGRGTATYQVNSCNVVIKTRPELDRPDMQIMVNPIRFDAQTWFPGIKPRQQDVWWAGVVQLHPESRGWVELKSADPREVAAVTLNIIDTENDRRQLRDAIRLTRKLYTTAPMADLVGEEKTPGLDVESDDELDAYLTDAHRLELSDQRLEEENVYSDTGGNEITGYNSYGLEGTLSDYYSARLFSDWTEDFSTEVRFSRSEVSDRQDPVGFGEAQSDNPTWKFNATAPIKG